MTYFSLFVTIFTLHLLAVSSPGPDFFLVSKISMQYGKHKGKLLSLGIALGVAVHIIYSLTGIALLLKNNPQFFKMVKYLGAIYIFYLGFKTIVNRKTSFKTSKMFIQKTEILSNIQAVKTGFITNLLNPKASLFFLSIFSVIIPQQTPFFVFLLIIIMILTTNYFWFYIVAEFFTLKHISNIYFKYEENILIIFGILLIVIGLKIFFV